MLSTERSSSGGQAAMTGTWIRNRRLVRQRRIRLERLQRGAKISLDALQGRRRIGQAFQRALGVLFLGQDLQQARPAVESVVETVPALLEERMAGHLACEQRAGFLQLRLDQRVPGFPDGRLAAVALDPRREQ